MQCDLHLIHMARVRVGARPAERQSYLYPCPEVPQNSHPTSEKQSIATSRRDMSGQDLPPYFFLKCKCKEESL